MKIHRWLDFKVTKRCNSYTQKCIYCDVPIDSEDKPEYLTLETIHQTLLDARALGFDIFWILGGEPSLRKDAHKLFDPLSNDPNIILTVVTNGKKQNDEMYYALFNTRAIRACVQVSLDTLSPNNFKHVNPAQSIALITHLKKMADIMSSPNHRCEVEVHCVISRENHRNFDEFVKFFASRGIPVSLALVCPWKISESPMRFNEFTKDELVSIAKRIYLLKTNLDIDKFNYKVADFIMLTINNKMKKFRKCGAGLTHLVINGDGNVYRCMSDSFCYDKNIGNITKQRLHDILRQITQPRYCKMTTECFDGFAWDQIAIET